MLVVNFICSERERERDEQKIVMYKYKLPLLVTTNRRCPLDPSALQLQKNAGKRYSGPTSVRVPNATREWIRNRADGTTIASIIRYGPVWRDRMEALANENRELSENMAAAQKRLQKLIEENADLLKFKTRTVERMKTGGIFDGKHS